MGGQRKLSHLHTLALINERKLSHSNPRILRFFAPAAMSAQMAQANEAQRPELERRFSRQKETYETNLKTKANRLVAGRVALAEKYKESVSGLQQVQSRVLDVDLTQWKREQQLAGNGAMFNNNLDIIQQWCEGLADLIWTNRQQIKELERLLSKAQAGSDGADVVAQIRDQITQLLSSLITSTFVIEKQPPQVMKTNTRFTATVRLLVGGKLNVHMTPPQVRTS
jgi:signal transducer and activator of transcription 5B